MTFEIHLKVYSQGDATVEERAEAFTVEATDLADLETKLSSVSLLTQSSVQADADMSVLTWREP